MDTSKTLQDLHQQPCDSELQAGYTIDSRFVVISKIGVGGMGMVYLAEDKLLRRRVAVKLISGNADTIAHRRFAREVQLMAGIHSSAIVQVHDFGCDATSGLCYYVMDAHLLSPEKVETICKERLHCPPPVCKLVGITDKNVTPLSLETVLAGDRVVPEETAAHLALEILSAPRLIHENDPQIVHRDLKPSNLIFATDGHVMLSDFGIAKAHIMNSESTTTLTMGAGPGTPIYAAPEQKDARGVTVATDFYAFGLVLYRMLTGGLPGTASTLLPADISARVSRQWDKLITALLQRDPANRLQDHESVRRQLVSILASCRRRTRLRAICRFALIWVLPIAIVLAGAVTVYAAKNGERQGAKQSDVAPVFVAGTWSGLAGTGQTKTELRLRQRGTLLNGSWTWGAGDTRDCEGRVDGNTLTLKDKKFYGDTWTLTVSDDGKSMSGTGRKFNGGSYTVTFVLTQPWDNSQLKPVIKKRGNLRIVDME